MAAADRIGLLPVRHVRLVDLAAVAQGLRFLVGYGRAEFVHQQSCLVAGDAELGLKLERRTQF